MTAIQMFPVDLEQNTQEWLEWRKGGLGASDVPTVCGNNPWKTPYQLWQEKVGLVEPEDLSNNPNVQRGNNYESAARTAFEEKYGVFALPVCGQGLGDDHSHVRVSYDGLFTQNNGVINLEIKCPSDKKLTSIGDVLAQSAIAPNQGIEIRDDGALVTKEGLEKLGMAHYWDQTQYQMMLANAGITCLWLYDVQSKEGIAIWIFAQPETWPQMMEKVNAFWMNVLNHQEPELDPERDVLTTESLNPEDKAAFLAAEKIYCEEEAKLKVLEQQVKELKKSMATQRDSMASLMGSYAKAEGANGTKIARFYRRGNIDYKSALNDVAPDLQDDDLERYRKEGNETVRITTH